MQYCCIYRSKEEKLALKLSLNCYLQNLTNQIKWKLLHVINVNYLCGRQNLKMNRSKKGPLVGEKDNHGSYLNPLPALLY